MTPQESQLVQDMFDRLAKLETQPRDPVAERLIADGAARAPHALYALAQTALVQDEALRRANARIEELQAQADSAPQAEPEQRSFLDNMREAFGGGPRQAPPQRGSVPSVHAAPPQGGYQGQAQPGYAPQPAPQMAPGYSAPPPGGGSFLGTAASTAAGVVGGALLLDGIRSMFGQHGGFGRSAFADIPGDRGSPWNDKGWNDKGGNTAGSAADSDLARQAGIDHVGDAARNDANAGSGDHNLFANNDDNDAYDADYDNTDLDEDDFGDADAGADSGDSSDV